MTLAIPRALRERTLHVKMTNINSAGSVYLPVPFRGTVTKIYAVIDGAFTTADVTLTGKINGTAITNGVVTIPTSGSAAGNVATASPSAANNVQDGDYLQITTNAAGTGAVAAEIVVVIKS